jgi:O-antigen/teichoic acid export membrane protein
MVYRFIQSALQNDVLKGSATALAIRFVAAVLGFAMFALASRRMDTHSFGSLALIFNAMSFLSVAALCGQETLIVRSWGEYCGSDRPNMARGALVFGLQVVVGATTLMTALVALIWSFWDRSGSLPLMLAACAFLFSHSLLQFSGQFTRVAVGLMSGEVPRELLWRLIVVLVVGLHHLTNTAFSATEFFLVAAAALTVAVVVQAMQVLRVIPDAIRQVKSEYDVRSWTPRSLKMWLSALMDTTSQYLEVVAVAFVLGPAAAGFYFAITRITNVFAMITGSISIYAVPQISALFHSDAKQELQHILRLLAVIGAMLVGSTFLAIVIGGKLMLWLFGEAYVSIYPMLLVLAAGASIGALVGPAPHVLLLTGHEGAYPRIMAAGLSARFILIAVLGHVFGLMGAVVATALSMVFIAIALILACRRLVGLDPSLSFALLRMRQRFAGA